MMMMINTVVIMCATFISSDWRVYKGNRCRKNVTKFRPLSGGGFTDSSDVAQRPVSVIVHNDPASPYKYLLKPLNDPPQIHVVVPGALSFLYIYSMILSCLCLLNFYITDTTFCKHFHRHLQIKVIISETDHVTGTIATTKTVNGMANSAYMQ